MLTCHRMTKQQGPILACALVLACGGHLGDGNGGEGDASSDGAAGYGGGIASSGDTVPGQDATVAASVAGTVDAEEAGGGAAGPPFDAGPEGVCDRPLAPGDLLIDELMIESVAGTGDYGEWIEVQNTLDCTVDLRGLHGECPSGAKVRTLDVTDDVWILPGGTFVIADSDNPAENHYLPGTIVVWSGQPGDVLRNKGGTVSLMMNGALVDTVTYPALKLTVGTSVAFPANCPANSRSDWTAWQVSNASWFPGFLGTPNAPNDDVTCP